MLKGGWKIFPLFPPVVRKVLCTLLVSDLDSLYFSQITKEAVDSYKTGQRIPSCQLRAEWTKQSKPLQLTHQVTLEGAKQPYNYLCIVLDCDSITPAGIPSIYLVSVYGLQALCLLHLQMIR